MLNLLFKIFTGPLFDKVTKLVVDLRQKDVDEATIEAEVKKALLAVYTESAQHQAAIIMAETQGETWLQKNWRPLVAVSFSFILVFYALIVPIAVDWFGAPPLRVGDLLLSWIMNIVVIAVGGYIGGRTVEKVAKTLKG